MEVTIIRPRRGLSLDLKEIWRYRELLYFFAWRDVKVRYKQTLIGVAWAVIQPFFTMVIFSLFFGKLAKIPSNGIPYPIFYYSALLPWTYFANSLTNATDVMVQNQRVITKVYFPRLILPIAAVLPGLVDFGIAFTILIGMMFFYGMKPTLAILTLPAFLLIALLTALSVGVWLSGLNAIFRDVRYAVPFLIQLWLFASPVAYPTSIVPEKWRAIYSLNPMAGVIEGFRWAVVGKGSPPTLTLLISLGAVIVLLIGGMYFFRRIESYAVDMV